MRITALDTICLSRMHEPERQWITASYRTVKADCAIVRVHSDEGLVGIGEASAYGVPSAYRRMGGLACANAHRQGCDRPGHRATSQWQGPRP